MADKAVELTLVIKEATLDLADDKFAATLQEALDSVKNKLTDARVRYSATKAAVVGGVPTLEEKGVEVSVTVTF
jgi:hypothetical protein